MSMLLHGHSTNCTTIDPDTIDGHSTPVSTCRKDIKACEYGTHPCNGEPTKAEVQIASCVFKKLASTCSQPITIHTGGTVKQLSIL